MMPARRQLSVAGVFLLLLSGVFTPGAGATDAPLTYRLNVDGVRLAREVPPRDSFMNVSEQLELPEAGDEGVTEADLVHVSVEILEGSMTITPQSKTAIFAFLLVDENGNRLLDTDTSGVRTDSAPSEEFIPANTLRADRLRSGDDDQGIESIYLSIPNGESPSSPSDDWGYDQPVSPWQDNVPPAESGHRIWRSQRVVAATPAVGAAVPASWGLPEQPPRPIPNRSRPLRDVGEGGEVFHEFIYRSVTAGSVSTFQQRLDILNDALDNSWTYDSPVSPWQDMAPAVVAGQDILWSFREVEGTPTAGTTVPAEWVIPAPPLGVCPGVVVMPRKFAGIVLSPVELTVCVHAVSNTLNQIQGFTITLNPNVEENRVLGMGDIIQTAITNLNGLVWQEEERRFRIQLVTNDCMLAGEGEDEEVDQRFTSGCPWDGGGAAADAPGYPVYNPLVAGNGNQIGNDLLLEIVTQFEPRVDPVQGTTAEETILLGPAAEPWRNDEEFQLVNAAGDLIDDEGNLRSTTEAIVVYQLGTLGMNVANPPARYYQRNAEDQPTSLTDFVFSSGDMLEFRMEVTEGSAPAGLRMAVNADGGGSLAMHEGAGNEVVAFTNGMASLAFEALKEGMALHAPGPGQITGLFLYPDPDEPLGGPFTIEFTYEVTYANNEFIAQSISRTFRVEPSVSASADAEFTQTTTSWLFAEEALGDLPTDTDLGTGEAQTVTLEVQADTGITVGSSAELTYSLTGGARFGVRRLGPGDLVFIRDELNRDSHVFMQLLSGGRPGDSQVSYLLTTGVPGNSLAVAEGDRFRLTIPGLRNLGGLTTEDEVEVRVALTPVGQAAGGFNFPALSPLQTGTNTLVRVGRKFTLTAGPSTALPRLDVDQRTNFVSGTESIQLPGGVIGQRFSLGSLRIERSADTFLAADGATPFDLMPRDRLRVEVSGGSLPTGLLAFIDLNGLNDLDEAERISFTEGLEFATGSVGAGALLSGARTVYLVTDGTASLEPDSYTASLTLDLDAAGSSADPSVTTMPAVTTLFQGINEQGFAYAVPNCTQVERGHISIINETATPLSLFLSGRDQNGAALGLVELDASLARGDGESRLQPHETLLVLTGLLEQLFMLNEGDCVAADTWAGRAQLTFLSNGNITVIPQLRGSLGELRDIGGFTGLSVGEEKIGRQDREGR